MLRKRGTGRAVRVAALLAIAPVLLVGLVVISVIGGVFAGEAKKRR
jgi:hypothetical protein